LVGCSFAVVLIVSYTILGDMGQWESALRSLLSTFEIPNKQIVENEFKKIVPKIR